MVVIVIADSSIDAGAVAAVLAGFLAGAIPFSNLMARVVRGVDLRSVGPGTVSGTGLYRVAGFGPLAVAGVCDVAKGAVGPLAAGGRPVVSALAGGAAVVGHNWSPWLRGAGGRGISPALGALLVRHWPGTVILLLGLVIGKAFRHTGAGSFVADLLLVPALAAVDGRIGALAGTAVVVPMLVKRVVGNRPPEDAGIAPYMRRLVFDHDGAP